MERTIYDFNYFYTFLFFLTGIDCIITQYFNSTTYILFIWSNKCCEQARFSRIGLTWCALIFYNLGLQQKVKEDNTEFRNSISSHLLAHHPWDLFLIYRLISWRKNIPFWEWSYDNYSMKRWILIINNHFHLVVNYY